MGRSDAGADPGAALPEVPVRAATAHPRRFADLKEKRAAFEAEALPFVDNLYFYAVKTLGDRSDADCLVQETFLRAFKGFETFQPGTNLKAWLFKILNNTLASMMRKRRATPVGDGEILERGAASDAERMRSFDTELSALEGVMDEHLEYAVKALPADAREILILADIEEMPYEEIARVLDLPEGTVKSRVSRARARLREAFLMRRSREEHKDRHAL